MGKKEKKQENRELERKLSEYKASVGLSGWDRVVLGRECRRLEEKLGIERIEPKAYIFLRKIADEVSLEREVNLSRLAKESGYPEWKASRPEVAILRDIDDKLFSEIVGISRKDVEFQLMKVLKQDKDLGSKMRALELASKVMGMSESDGKVQIQVNSGISISE